MSAENAWRIAKEAAAECADRCECPERLLEVSPFFFSGTEAVGDSLRALPMPPAFRAAVEAETEELRGMLRQARDALNDAREELEEYEADATGECYNRPSLNWILERIDAVLFPPRSQGGAEMNEAQMLISLGMKPTPRRGGLAAPALANLGTAEVWDSEAGGTRFLPRPIAKGESHE